MGGADDTAGPSVAKVEDEEEDDDDDVGSEDLEAESSGSEGDEDEELEEEEEGEQEGEVAGDDEMDMGDDAPAKSNVVEKAHPPEPQEVMMVH